jgi:hypothetical protein
MNLNVRHGIVAVLALILHPAAQAQGSLLTDALILQSQIDQHKELVTIWESRADIEFLLVILVVLLGAVVALLQKVNGKKWCSVVVAISGIAISVLTFGSKEYFEVDQKTYRKSAEAVRWEIRSAETYLALIKRPEVASEDKQELMVKVAKTIAKIDAIAHTVQKIGAADLDRVVFVARAHAQAPARPAWIDQVRSETKTSFRAVGSSRMDSVAAAQTQARLNAQNLLAETLKVPLSRVQQYAVTVETYLEYNAVQNTYHCYALLELNKAFVR